jgi:hypothetical protein
MEDILVALIQGLFEILGGICEVGDLLELLVKGVWYITQAVYAEWPSTEQGVRAGWISMLYLLLGLMSGAISVHFCHDVFFRRSATRLTLFFVTPLLTGISSWIMAHFRLALGSILVPRYYFWWALFFSVGLCVIRFGFCHRPEM